MVSEAVMMGLAPAIGRQNAHDIVYDACRVAAKDGRALYDVLREMPELQGKLTDDDLRRTVRTGISGTMMPAFKKLTTTDLDAVIVYIKSLSTRWGRPGLKTDPRPTPAEPSWIKDPTVRSVHAAAGGALFAKTCSVCHGASGKGDGPGSGGLKDVWGHAILPADLSTGRFKSGPGRSDLYRSITLGLDGTPMAGFNEALKPSQVWDLIAYIESLKIPTKPR